MRRILLVRPPVLLVFAMVLSILVSCDPNRLFEENYKIPNHLWNKDQSVEFISVVEDTLQVQNIYINIRNTGNYRYSNLYLYITTTAPSGQWIKDTLNIQLADSKGKWLGSGLGDIFFSRKLYKSYIRFPLKGDYKFSIQHGMRVDDLDGIRDVGIRIEKTTVGE